MICSRTVRYGRWGREHKVVLSALCRAGVQHSASPAGISHPPICLPWLWTSWKCNWAPLSSRCAGTSYEGTFPWQQLGSQGVQLDWKDMLICPCHLWKAGQHHWMFCCTKYRREIWYYKKWHTWLFLDRRKLEAKAASTDSLLFPRLKGCLGRIEDTRWCGRQLIFCFFTSLLCEVRLCFQL